MRCFSFLRHTGGITINAVGEGKNILLQHPFQRRRVHIPSRWDLVDEGHQIGEALAAFVGDDARDGDVVHLGIEVVELDEAAGGVLVCEMPQGVFDYPADFGLGGRCVSSVWICRQAMGEGGWKDAAD